MAIIKRIKLISVKDHQEIYNPAQFNLNERDLFFSLNEKKIVVIKKLSGLSDKFFFILHLGISGILSIKSPDFFVGQKNRYPVAWKYIHLFGNYEFKNRKNRQRL